MESLPVRRKIRLNGYGYSQNGAHFITFCTEKRRMVLGEISVGAHIVRPQLSAVGQVVEEAIKNIATLYPSIFVDKYVIMPNHIHLILLIENENGRTVCAPTVSRIIKHCKEYVTKRLGYPIWQKSFHDHIIRDATDYQTLWEYVDTNPARWAEDEYFKV